MTEIQLAYLAGYIDGDGCFYIDNVKAKTGIPRLHYRTILKFASVDKGIMEWLSEFLGMSFWTKSVSKKRKHLPYREVFEANLTGERLDFLLPKIYPYLRIKKEHCKIMMNMRQTYIDEIRKNAMKPPTKEVYEIRHKCHMALRSINTHKPICPSALSP